MKRYMIGLSILLLTPASSVFASNVAFNAGVSVGLPGASVNFGVGAPAYPYRPVTIVEPPMFVQPPELGFHTAVGVPYDLFFLNNLFYLFSGNAWYSSPYYNGPWSSIYAYDVPYLLSRHPFHRIRHYRDHYYGYYKRYGRWDGYHHFRPERRHAGWDHGHRGGPAGHAAYSRPYPRGYGHGDRRAHDGRIYNRPGHGPGLGPSFARPRNPSRVFGDRHTYTRPGNPSGLGGGGTLHNRHNPSGRHHPAPSYSRPSGPVQANMSRPSFSRPSAARHDSVGRPSFSRHGHGGHGGHRR